MSNYTLLTDEQTTGSEQLEVLQKRGTKAAITDFAILLGGYVDDDFHIDTDSSLKGRTGWYWTKSDDGDNDARAVSKFGSSYWDYVSKRDVGVRPALPFSSISDISTNGVSGAVRAADGVLEIEAEPYPQTAPAKRIQEILNNKLKTGSLKKVADWPTTDSRKFDEYDKEFLKYSHGLYEYEGKRYVYVKANSDFGDREFTLSNGEKYHNGDFVWVEVEPVKRWIDEKAKVTIPEKIIFAGVQFNKERNYKTKNFKKTGMKKFLDECYAKDIERYPVVENNKEKNEENIEQNLQVSRKSRLQKLNPDTTKLEDRRNMTDTEIIKSWIENGESVLLRGPSGIGKTDRIRKSYPNLIELKLTNNMFPEKVVGSTNIQTGQEIPPSYARQIIIQSATEEERKAVEENIQNIYAIADQIYERSQASDEKQVILLDELLNVNPHIQSLVYTLVLNRFVEIGKGIKLPDNVVIVATGNQQKYSSTSYEVAEPLEKRFDHILDMEPKVGEWLTEYAIPEKVHPAVIGYIMSKYNTAGKSENIDDMGYFYEEPEIGEKNLDKYGQRGKTNDPRGWTSVSTSLYGFERDLESGKYKGINVENKLKRNLETKLRMEWAEEFYDFYNLPTLTPEDVVKGEYTQADLPRDIDERFAYMSALITADEKQVEACREFIRKYCDPEYLSVYDIYWAGKDERRMEKMSELQMLETTKEYTSEDISIFAENGAKGYDVIGQMYKDHLQRESANERINPEDKERGVDK